MRNKKMRVYISGKITGTTDYKEKFHAAADKLSVFGYIPVDPTRGEPEGKAWNWYMRKDIKKLMKCDAIYLLPDWKESKGARLEKSIAQALGLIVFEEKK